MDDRERPDNSDAERAFGDDRPRTGGEAFGLPGGFEPPVAPDAPPPPPRQTVGDTGFAPPVPPPPPPGRPVAGPGSTWPAPPPPNRPPMSSKANTALVLGIVSWLICPIVLSVMAMVYAQQAKREIDADPGAIGGRGRAEAAMWIGATSLVVYGVLLVVALAGGIDTTT
jgi:Wiskott-Aldrich syndrome protein